MANIKNLNESLMKRIEALEDEDLTEEQLEIEIKRSQAITKVADTIINCARKIKLFWHLKDGERMKDYSILDELVPKTQELHRAIFDKGYEQGQKDILDKKPCDNNWRFYYNHGYAQAKRDLSCEDCISRQAVLDINEHHHGQMPNHVNHEIWNEIKALPSVTPKEKTGWIPVSERLPEDTYPVNITWVNHAPEPYYATIKDKPFTATGCYCDGKWYWYSVTCQDYLDEYRYCDVDSMDEAIEVIAWMPLPAPFEPQESEVSE